MFQKDSSNLTFTHFSDLFCNRNLKLDDVGDFKKSVSLSHQQGFCCAAQVDGGWQNYGE